MSIFRHRMARPSAEALAAVEAANRAHEQAIEKLHGIVNLDPEVRAQEQLLQAHNEANHWQEWLFGSVLTFHRSG